MKSFLILMSFVLLASCANDKSAIQTSLEWSRMAPLPEGAQDIRVSSSGSSFTREFSVSFKATATEIEAWLSKSPGAQDATVVKESNITIYSINPGGGAQFAEVKVNLSSLIVQIRTYWS